jgi:A/G-specific adenine glycosylase
VTSTASSAARHTAFHAAGLRRALLAWYDRHRRPLPWRERTDPYAILVSEVMLQQTQVVRVEPFFHAWIERFPDVHALARASARTVLLAWGGLGYNRRALHLLAAARRIETEHAGTVPADPERLMDLPGIGRYTAHAVACFAYHRRLPVVDVNVRRILSRLVTGPSVAEVFLPESESWALASLLLPRKRFFDWNQALMDLGAMVCTATRPSCGACPLRNRCLSAFRITAATRASGAAARPIPRRVWRGRVLAALRLAPRHRLSLQAIHEALLRHDGASEDDAWLEDILASMRSDGLLVSPAGARRAHGSRRMVELAE